LSLSVGFFFFLLFSLTVVVADECVEIERRLIPAPVFLLEVGVEFIVVEVDVSGVGGERHCF
jgi:hypothetical protein